MAGGGQRALDAGYIDGHRGEVGKRKAGNEVQLGSVLTGQVKLTLEVKLSDFEITHGHADLSMTQQLHESGKAHSEPEHFGGISVPPIPAPE